MFLLHFLYGCVYVYAYRYHGTCVEVENNLSVDFLLMPCRCWESTLGHEVWEQAPLPAEPSCQLLPYDIAAVFMHLPNNTTKSPWGSYLSILFLPISSTA